MSNTRAGGLIRPHQSKIAVLYRLADAALVVLSLYISTLFYTQPWHDRYSFAALLAVGLLLVLGGRFGLYRSWRVSHLFDEVFQLWIAWLGAVLGILIIVFALKTTSEYSCLVTGTWFLVTPFVLTTWRFIYRNILYEMRRRGRNTRSVVWFWTDCCDLECRKAILR